jgi:hypothetical protein
MNTGIYFGGLYFNDGFLMTYRKEISVINVEAMFQCSQCSERKQKLRNVFFSLQEAA